ncbi:hypothetical protein AMATHDRAFT_6622 [Amanita thiersii Skay4041]|uniref:Uncharacterized protein n=1 Tax=Amanita thiersii Skay4041 TaxID=703135 RepID=A0A2A9NE23_9AGAR|nr:hypothetical protein AMATHDRAFT_6622 [Amanita thiersii Skay4041]
MDSLIGPNGKPFKSKISLAFELRTKFTITLDSEQVRVTVERDGNIVAFENVSVLLAVFALQLIIFLLVTPDLGAMESWTPLEHLPGGELVMNPYLVEV